MEISKYNTSRNITGNGCSNNTNCTINNEIKNTITINNGGGTLTIEDSGNVNVNVNKKPAISVSDSNSTIINKGSIVGKEQGISYSGSDHTLNNQGFIQSNGAHNAVDLWQSTIVNLNNSGTIHNNGSNAGIKLNANNNKNKSTIKNLTNSGVISSNKGYGILVDRGHIDTLNNSGTIISKESKDAIFINNDSFIKTLSNSGTIGGNQGILVDGKIETLKNSGVISGNKIENTAGVSLQKNGAIINTLINSGTINGYFGVMVGLGSNSIINTLDNKKLIQGEDNGINIWSGTIVNLNNSGTIKGNKNNGIEVGSGNGKRGTVNTLNNTGSIIGDKFGILVGYGSKIGTLENNSVIIGNKANGIEFADSGVSASLATEIDCIKNAGTILGNKYGISISNSNKGKEFKIGKIDISGLVAGGTAGFYIGDNQKLTEDITISGTLAGGTAGIINKGTLGNTDGSGGIKLDNGGVITALNSTKARINHNGPAILNAGSGVIYGNTDLKNNSKLIGGIVNQENGQVIGNILVQSGSSITGGIVNNDNGIVTGSIKVQGKNSSIEGGITNAGNGKLNGSIEVSDGAQVDNIINTGSGTISGSVSVGEGSKVESVVNSGEGTISGSITNNGNLGSITNSGNISGNIENNNGNIEINNDGKLNGAIQVGANAGNTSISNGSNGNIGGGITNNSNANVNISNQGMVKPDSNGNHITNNGSGSVVVEDWIVKPNENGSINGAISVGGNGSGSTSIDKVTIDTSDKNFDASKPINPDSIINNNTTGSGGFVSVGNVASNNNLLDYAYNPITGEYMAKAQVSQGMASVLAQTLINTYIMRSFFLDSVIDEASKEVYKHAREEFNAIKGHKDLKTFKANEDGYYHGFVLPYFSSNNIKLLGTNHYSTGNTKGVLAGFHTIKDIGMLGAYIGTEEAKMNTQDYFSLKMQTIYAGLKYDKMLFQDNQKDVFFKSQTKVAYTQNDMEKYIDKGAKKANGDTDTYGYGASVGAGINFYLANSIINPKFNLAYEGGIIKAFSMSGEAALNHERYYENKLNLFSSTASISWMKQWHPQISTSLEAGTRINFNPEVNSKVNFASLKSSETLDLPRTYQYLGASLVFALEKDLTMSFNYNGIFANNANSHTGYMQFDFKF
ncbi:hypothetical protein FPD38_06570 [Campylobacter volucris]|uniref:Autotransporter domain-containing protein n=1 Tax=Campylobacter volucris TaxID=1031542 RepID=A0A5C7DPK3_9BACT|nr:hypothetical protein [Campylobacter volucris]TXE86305.1 hypothetical protein FPD38_06570 [Campylobacter volucris]